MYSSSSNGQLFPAMAISSIPSAVYMPMLYGAFTSSFFSSSSSGVSSFAITVAPFAIASSGFRASLIRSSSSLSKNSLTHALKHGIREDPPTSKTALISSFLKRLYSSAFSTRFSILGIIFSYISSSKTIRLISAVTSKYFFSYSLSSTST